MTQTLADFARRMRPLVEQQRSLAADLRELMTEMRDIGLEGGTLKQWMAAIIDAEETGKDRKLKRLMSKTQDVAIYGEMLGYSIDGFGETKRSVLNDFDPRTGEVVSAPLAKAARETIPAKAAETAAPVTATEPEAHNAGYIDAAKGRPLDEARYADEKLMRAYRQGYEFGESKKRQAA